MSVFKQCRLLRKNTLTTSWIPAKFAKVGKCIKLCDVDGWKVISVDSERTKEQVTKLSKLDTRKMSDI